MTLDDNDLEDAFADVQTAKIDPLRKATSDATENKTGGGLLD